jgi:hypothetical protein
MKNLQILDLSYNEMGDRGVEILANEMGVA